MSDAPSSPLHVTVPIDRGAPSATSYEVHVGRGVLASLPTVLRELGLSAGRVAIVTDSNVARHHLTSVITAIDAAGLRYTTAIMPAGEVNKTIFTVHGIASTLAAEGVDRHGVIVGLGGGVVGDVAGFVAATFMRGIPVVQCPTSLLAMVDASIGGKTGVDLPEGKNLVGAFHHPRAVLADPSVLSTLPEPELRSGCAEVIKHAIIGSPQAPTLLDALESAPIRAPEHVDAVLREAMAVKVDVVSEDPGERGRRALLNLGHTFGHALERVRNYQIRHGEAVAIGTLAACRYAELTDQTEGTALRDRVRTLVSTHGLPELDATLEASAVDALVDAMSTDKKRAAGRLRLVVPRAIGDVVIDTDVDPAALREATASMCRRSG